MKTKSFRIEDVIIRYYFCNKMNKITGIEALWNNKHIGVLEFAETIYISEPLFQVTYLKINRRFQQRGVATKILQRMIDDHVPAATPKIVFFTITSDRTAKLIQDVFGKLYWFKPPIENDDFPWGRMEQDSPQENLRYARGYNGYTLWPIQK